MDEAVASGVVWHRRSQPRAHQFRYRLYYSLLDVDRLDAIFSKSRWWSLERFNLVSLRRTDCIGPFDRAIGDAVRERVRGELGFVPDGRIRMLTHLRQWGFCFNPVTFYFCEHATALQAIVAEVHNTPWGERHAYVLDARDQSGPVWRFEFAKAFHVSPFLPMGLDYDWRFVLTGQSIGIHMLVTEHGAECFRAGMKLALSPLDHRAMGQIPLRFPLVTLKVVTAIYWQAFRLWIKRIPFHSHPDSPEQRR